MYLLGVDLETTGLDHKSDCITEVGAVVWCTQTRAPVHYYSTLIERPNQEPMSQEVIDITGITDHHLHHFGRPAIMALGELDQLAKRCDYLVAHNAEFEMKFIGRWVQEHKHPEFFDSLREKPWLDTKLLPYPASIGPRDLVSLCSHHGFFNPHPHRALWDAWAMMKILDSYHVNLNEVLEAVHAPKVKLWSQGITFATKDRPKSLGYYWDGESKRWYTTVRESDRDEAIKKAKDKGFGVTVEQTPLLTNIRELEAVAQT